MNTNENYVEYYEKEKKRTKGLFFALLIITAIIMFTIGGSFAYFIATASSDEGAVQAGSKNYTLGYTDDASGMKTEMIPASYSNAIYAGTKQPDGTIPDNKIGTDNEVENAKCEDDYGRYVCSIYKFTITNPSDSSNEITINVKLNPVMNTFTNLYLAVADASGNIVENGTDGQGFYIDPSLTEYQLTGLTKTLQPGESVDYEMVIFIKDIEEDQTLADADKLFQATVTVSPEGESGEIKGIIQANSGDLTGGA